jgi:hypothetical protein
MEALASSLDCWAASDATVARPRHNNANNRKWALRFMFDVSSSEAPWILGQKQLAIDKNGRMRRKGS